MAQPAFKRVEQLFHQAVALEPAERSSFLHAACAGDADLRAAVEELLRHHTAGKDTDNFLVSPLSQPENMLDSQAPTMLAHGPVSQPPSSAPLPHVPGYLI